MPAILLWKRQKDLDNASVDFEDDEADVSGCAENVMSIWTSENGMLLMLMCDVVAIVCRRCVTIPETTARKYMM